MYYKRKCQKCEKEYQARRPHSRFCGENCRVGSHNIQKRRTEKIKFLQTEIQNVQDQIAIHEDKISEIEKSCSDKQTLFQQVKQRQSRLEEELILKFSTFNLRYQGKSDPITGKKVPVLDMDQAPHPLTKSIFRERQSVGGKKRWEFGAVLGDIEEKIMMLQSALQKEKEELAAAQEALQKYQHQYAQLLKKELLVESPATSINKVSAPISPKAQYIGAADLLKKEIRTFMLPGILGEFLGELERHMLAIALVGDPGAGKSTITIAIARTFDLAGYNIIFYSLELGIGKPLQNMIRRNPLSNRVSITDKGDLAVVRESANSYDLVMVENIVKVGH